MLVNLKYYGSEDMGLMMTSRGCPYNCSYCATSVWGKKVRYRSIENVVREIRMVKDRGGCRQFTFKDDCFTLNKNRVIDLCGTLLKERIAINWECNTRINLIDEEILTKMKKAGCNSIKVGIESGSERVLRFINKKITLDQCKNAAKLLHKIGIHWTGYFMIGLPSETKEEMCQTLQFMKELRPDYASISVYEPFPGTELFEIGIEKGLVERDRSLEDFFSISPKYYYVKDVQHRIDTMGNGEFEKIEEELKEKFHKYNAGIPRLAKRAKARGSLYAREPKILWSDFKKFLSWL